MSAAGCLIGVHALTCVVRALCKQRGGGSASAGVSYALNKPIPSASKAQAACASLLLSSCQGWRSIMIVLCCVDCVAHLSAHKSIGEPALLAGVTSL
jgi:hypothetical protein